MNVFSQEIFNVFPSRNIPSSKLTIETLEKDLKYVSQISSVSIIDFE